MVMTEMINILKSIINNYYHDIGLQEALISINKFLDN